jgi:peptidoglycan/LPS O-acetylase OafA/YrhL
MTLSAPAVRSTAAKSKTKRLDIQGLRAVAVLSVIANHVFGIPGGGFVGVDVFFVISGFVITSVMLREHDQTGRINFVNFYKHRVRRILPASTVTLAATVAVSMFIYLPGRVHTILTDAVWAVLFAGNWRFASNGTDYWAKDTPTSPLQHYWSLGVEEQYYFVWPAVVVLVLVVVGSTRTSSRGRLALTLAVPTASSFAWSMYETAANPTSAYFSTTSRAWELGIGALIAIGAGAFARITPRVRTVLAWAGMGGIAVSLMAITKESAFPAPWAALPALATALVIVAGTGGAAHGIAALTNRPMNYMGDISYSLYLWHFPVVVLLATLIPGRGKLYFLVAILATASLSLLSYYFVEQRVLKSTWLSKDHGGPRHDSAFDSRGSKRGRARLGLFAAAIVGALALIITVVLPSGGSGPVNSAPSSPTRAAPGAGMNQAALTAQLDAALASTSWPELKPSVDTILADSRPTEDNDGCGHTDLTKPDCSWDTGKQKTVVVLGDSTGITLLPTVRAALGERYNVRGMTMAGCAALDIKVKADKPEFAIDCDKFKADSIKAINKLKPAMVFLSSTSEILAHLVSEVAEDQAGPEWRQGTANELKALEPSGARLFVVTAPPLGKPPVDCATRFSTPKDCEYTVPRSHVLTAQAMQEAAAAGGAAFIDTRSWFCSGNECPAFIGGTPLKRDNVHTTRQYAVLLAGVLRDTVTAAQK